MPESRAITGNMAMPGFTAPKLLWLAKYGPPCSARCTMLLPKDYLIWRLSGEFVSEMSDASGTLGSTAHAATGPTGCSPRPS